MLQSRSNRLFLPGSLVLTMACGSTPEADRSTAAPAEEPPAAEAADPAAGVALAQDAEPAESRETWTYTAQHEDARILNNRLVAFLREADLSFSISPGFESFEATGSVDDIAFLRMLVETFDSPAVGRAMRSGVWKTKHRGADQLVASARDLEVWSDDWVVATWNGDRIYFSVPSADPWVFHDLMRDLDVPE